MRCCTTFTCSYVASSAYLVSSAAALSNEVRFARRALMSGTFTTAACAALAPAPGGTAKAGILLRVQMLGFRDMQESEAPHLRPLSGFLGASAQVSFCVIM